MPDVKIVLMRHGRPELRAELPIYAREFKGWVSRYDHAPLARDSTPTGEAISFARAASTVFCSSLLRSSMSAEMLNKNATLNADEGLVEAGIPYSEWGVIKLPPKYWAVLFRLFWFLGYSNHSESYSDAKSRAILAAAKLAHHSEVSGPVLYVGHGIFNRLVAKELKKLGWSGPGNISSNYWGCSVYRKCI
jgi:broad specificity phosphatase PhoE